MNCIPTDSGVYEGDLFIYSNAQSVPKVHLSVFAKGLFESSPKAFLLARIAPNPFSEWTFIKYEVPITSQVKIEVFDVTGRCVNILAKRIHAPGKYSIKWYGVDKNGIKLPSGIYFFSMETPYYKAMRKFIIIR